MKLVDIPQRSESWTDFILALKPEQEMKAPIVKERTIRSLISGSISYKHPERSFKTSKAGDFLIVKRTA